MTSHEDMINTDKKTGLWIGEFTDPYYEFKDKGYTITLASPKGGSPPIDPFSELTENITSSNRRFVDDDFAQHALKHTLELEDVISEDYDALFYPGGHAPMFDLANDKRSGELISEFLDDGKPVGLVCCYPQFLVKAAELNPKLYKGKK